MTTLVVKFVFAHEGLNEQPLVADEGVARVLPGGGLVLLNEEVRVPRESVTLNITLRLRGHKYRYTSTESDAF